MVMAIISAVSAGILLIMSSFSLSLSNHFGYRYRDYYGLSHVSYGLLIAMGATMLIVAIASASLTCYPLCCRSTKQGAVHYRPNQAPAIILCLFLCLCLCHTLISITNRCPPTCLSMPTRSQHSTSQQYKTCKPTLQHRSRFCQSRQSLQLTKMLPEWEANIRSFNRSSVFQDAQR